MTNLTDVTRQLGTHYLSWKEFETSKNECKNRFFEAVTEKIRNEWVPVEKYAICDALSEAEARKELERMHSGWLIDTIRENPDAQGEWEAIMVEDPELKAFTYVNPEDGMVYTRQVVSGSPTLDDERLKAEDPDLWREITYVPHFDAIIGVMYEFGVDGVQMDKFDRLWDICEGPRLLRPLDELPPETAAKLQRYVYIGRPTVKLSAPRKAKPEELDE